MAQELNVNTFEEIAEVLSHLATNYSNIAGLFYSIFYDENPQEVSFQMYDDAGVLKNYTVKNLALSNNYRVTGSNTPEGTVPAAKGTIYQDLVNGDVFVKRSDAPSNENWYQLVSKALLDGYIMQGVSDPNGTLVGEEQTGVVDADPGTLYIDTSSTTLYIRLKVPTGEGNYWEVISASTGNFADIDLSNLSDGGKATIKSLATEETGTMVTVIDSSNTDSQYPSAKAVYTTVSALGTAISDLSTSVGSLPADVASVTQAMTNLSAAMDLKQNASDRETVTLTNNSSKYPSSALVYSLLGDVETLINNL